MHEKDAGDQARPCKFRIPRSLHVRLHQERILRGVPLSILVNHALRDYFEAHPELLDGR